MNRFAYFFLTLSLLGIYPHIAEARGGRGEGFRGGDMHEDRGAQTHRSPSMSRTMPQTRERDNLNRFHDDVRTAKPAAIDGKINNLNRTRFPQQASLDTIKNREADRFHHKQSLGDEIRRNIYTNNHRPPQWFNHQFWHDHPNPWYHNAENINWWKWATWASVSTWLAWDLASPVYYDYGENGNVYYNGDNVYIDGEEAYNANEYAQQAESLIDSPVQVDPNQTSWLPLGVFALTSDEKSSTTPNMYLQLALSKEGILSGTYINDTTQIVQPITGRVDKLSQIAVWRVQSQSQNTPVMETGIENLTQGETSILVHFPDGTTQTWFMVRLQQPES